MKDKRNEYKEALDKFDTSDLKTVNTILEKAETKNIRELAKLYQAVRKNKIKINDVGTKDAICLYLSDIIVTSIVRKKRSPYRIVIGILCILTSAFIALCMFLNYKYNQENEAMIQDIQQMHQEAVENETELTEDSSEDNEILSELLELYNINTDLVGWMQIEGTDIDYPIVQTTDNNYYLSHDFYKQENVMGNPFLDCRNVDISDTNLIVYGHNTQNGTMFSSLNKYEEYEYFQRNQVISYDTLYGKYRYRIVAVCKGKVANKDEDVFRYYNFTQASSIDELQAFWNNMKEQSIHTIAYEFNESDHYLTLSTCNNYVENGRLYVVAVREE